MNTERQKLKDEVYSNMATQLARLSKDKNTHLGAIIIASDGTPVSFGYNGTVSGFDDDSVPHSRDIETLHYTLVKVDTSEATECTFVSNKYPFMSHAESNAIFFADKNKLNGSTIYITGFPCENCALQIARANISRVVVNDLDSNLDSGSTVNQDLTKSMYIFAQKGIKLTWNGDNYILKCEK